MHMIIWNISTSTKAPEEELRMEPTNSTQSVGNLYGVSHSNMNQNQGLGNPPMHYNSQQFNGTTYYNQSGTDPASYLGSEANVYHNAPYQPQRGRGRGRNSRGYGDPSHYHGYPQEQSYHYHAQQFAAGYEFNQGNNMSQPTAAYNEGRSDSRKVKSYQDSRRSNRQEGRGGKYVNENVKSSSSGSVSASNTKTEENANQRTPNRNSPSAGPHNKNRTHQPYTSSRRYNKSGRGVRHDGVMGGARPENDSHPSNVENLNYTHDKESAESQRKWEHETSNVALGQKSEQAEMNPKRDNMTVLGHAGFAKTKQRGKTSDHRNRGSENQMDQQIDSNPRGKKQPPKRKNTPSSGRGKGYGRGYPGRGRGRDEDDETQRGSLIEQLRSNSYECMVCCDNVRREAAVWSCNNCYHVFHLHCIKKWARSPNAAIDNCNNGWRCPACQNVSKDIPRFYSCFCGKVKDPDWNRFETPHSCGELCAKTRTGDCTHPCNILCHPGPCPPCHASVVKFCDCKKSKQTIKCDQSTTVKCDENCNKTLNCGIHECRQVCHSQSCGPCEDQITQSCHCSKESRTVVCGTSEFFQKSFTCNKTCGRALGCGNHQCERLCHPGPCEECSLLPEKVLLCPCGRTPLTELTEGPPRLSCTQPIPTCDHICDKPLQCGPPEKPHTCQMKCHEGKCGDCTGDTVVTCRCRGFDKELPCSEAILFNENNPFTCERRCNKKKTCGRHKCANLCCTETEHTCDQICGHKLTCGLHRCEEKCHKGNCLKCWHVSFDELHCECGTEVLYPPIQCGTKPPECAKPCTRQHGCQHKVIHSCHNDENCPPCTHLTEKWCFGHHELRKNIPCYLSELSCGLPCNKDLPCRKHKCLQTCHKGPCMGEGAECSQPCQTPREECGHPCNSPCHPNTPCPATGCRAQVLIKCECGQRSEKTFCQVEASSDYQNMATSLLAMKISEAQDGQTFDISSLTKDTSKKKARKLECNSECAVHERNKRLALALEIKNPDLSGKLGNPVYTAFLKDYAKQNLKFLAKVERSFSELVKAAEQSKQPRRSHAFEAMPSVQRRVIHELADFYGCDSMSYDVEPKKNVVITAHRDRCWHPSITLTALVQRETNPKAPLPIPHRFSEGDLRSLAQSANQSTDVIGPTKKRSKITFTSKNIASTVKEPAAGSVPSAEVSQPRGMTHSATWSSMVINSGGKTAAEPAIDYFDMTD